MRFVSAVTMRRQIDASRPRHTRYSVQAPVVRALSLGRCTAQLRAATCHDAPASRPRITRAPLRVLMLSWEYPPVVVGGLGRHVHALATALAPPATRSPW